MKDQTGEKSKISTSAMVMPLYGEKGYYSYIHTSNKNNSINFFFIYMLT
jgi:hypothetical protein